MIGKNLKNSNECLEDEEEEKNSARRTWEKYFLLKSRTKEDILQTYNLKKLQDFSQICLGLPINVLVGLVFNSQLPNNSSSKHIRNEKRKIFEKCYNL